MKKILISLVVLIVLLFGVLWLYKLSNPKLITVGVLTSYSNSNSSASVDSFRSAEMAFSEINSEKEKYRLIRIDTDTTTTPDDLRNSLEVHDLDMLLGPTTSSELLKYRSMLESLDIPIFLVSVSSNEITGISDNFFRLTDNITIQVSSLLTGLNAVTEVSTVDVLYSSNNSGFSKPFALSAKSSLESTKQFGQLLEVGELEDLDVQNLLINSTFNDQVIIVAGPGQAGIIAELIAINNPNVTFVFPAWAYSDRTFDYTKNLTNQVYTLSSIAPYNLENYNNYLTNLKELKSTAPTNFTFFGYEVAYFMDFVVRACDSTKLSDIQAQIHNMNIYEGQFNNFTLNDFGDGGRGYSFSKIEDGKASIIIDSLE